MIQEQRYLKLLRSAVKEVNDWAHELFCSYLGKIKHSIRPKEYNLTMQLMHGWQHLIAYNFLTKLYRYFLFLNLDKQHSLLCIVHTHISLVEFKVWTMNILNMNELKTSSRCRANKLKLNEGNNLKYKCKYQNCPDYFYSNWPDYKNLWTKCPKHALSIDIQQ